MSSSVLKRDAGQRLPRMQWPSDASSFSLSDPTPALRAGSTPGATALEKEAFDRGYREGEAAAARKNLDQVHAAVQAFSETASSLAGYKAALRSEVERELVALSLAVAQKIIRRELSIDPDIILAVVRSCLEQLQSAEIYRLRLNPQDVAAVAGCFNRQQAPVEIVPDAAIARGGAIFETSQGTLDARLDRQLQEIERGLADR